MLRGASPNGPGTTITSCSSILETELGKINMVGTAKYSGRKESRVSRAVFGVSKIPRTKEKPIKYTNRYMAFSILPNNVIPNRLPNPASDKYEYCLPAVRLRESREKTGPSMLSGIAGGGLQRIATRRKHDAVLRRLVGHALSFLTAREIACLPRHDFAWVVNVEEDESDQHGERVKAVLIRFMVGDAAIEAV